MVKWYSLFSHTGRETETVHLMLDNRVILMAALTTNMDYGGKLDAIKLASGKQVNEWLMTPGHVQPESIITLNGYMRIIPEVVLQYLASINCRVFNIHPAPIWLYPELRGKDPQERLWEGLQSGKYTRIGAVIHEVDSGVDTGELVHCHSEFPLGIYNKDHLYDRLHLIGTEMWLDFFVEEKWKNGKNS